jgi:hypothetical protein
MRTLLITLAATASALVVATPASAQYFPQPQPQGYAYGYNNYGQARALNARIDAIQRQIQRLDSRNILSNREARRLSQEARELDRRLRYLRQNGLHPRERYDIEQRLARLEQRVFRDARDGHRWGNGYNSQSASYDRDRDGRDDRYEDDRGRHSDFDHDRDGRDDRYEDDRGTRHD